LYYPRHFQPDVTAILSGQDDAEKRIKKKELLDAVVKWSAGNPDEAERAFKESAGEVIQWLHDIEALLV
jgi:hypothetical protein